MRRVVVTPTFAAGLGVVVAAVLAYPMQTVFSYVAPGALGPGGVQCGQDGCANQPGHVNPAPFGVGGAISKAPSGSQTTHGTTTQPGHAGSGMAVARPQLGYKITNRWQGGFWGHITITFPGGVPPEWKLRFGYPGGHILALIPNSRLAANGHAALVRSSDYATGTGPGGRTFVVGVRVQGAAVPPARCSFDGRSCHIR
jgi:hypothetical protein